ncbi:hypothetical protein [Streptomyces sp. NPDC020817]|uniref:hypothetical protein n=1 Tax=Streptomyces sp. NPDC020817 TaxID=3365095 RepID=UPI003795EAAB
MSQDSRNTPGWDSSLATLHTLMPSDHDADEQIDWSTLTQQWGTAFPADYISFMAAYGPGSISDSLALVPPSSPSVDGTSIMGQETANALANLQGSTDLSVHSASKPAVIAWGVTVVGDIACWDTRNPDPDAWTVLVFKNRTKTAWTAFDCNMTEFLCRTFTGEFERNPFGDDTVWNHTPQRFVHHSEDFQDFDDPWAGL